MSSTVALAMSLSIIITGDVFLESYMNNIPSCLLLQVIICCPVQSIMRLSSDALFFCKSCFNVFTVTVNQQIKYPRVGKCSRKVGAAVGAGLNSL